MKIWTWILTTGQTPRKYGLRFWLKYQNHENMDLDSDLDLVL